MITLAKLSRPKTTGIVARERLFSRLDAARDSRAVWISGPPGAGKTTLAASWLEARGLPAIWYQADGGDADPASFFYYLRQGAADAGLCGEAQPPLLTPEYLADLPGFGRRYFRTLYNGLPRPCVLVFDNYQNVPDAAPFHAIVRDAMSEAPPGILIVVVSRSGPPASYAGLRLGRSLACLGWDALRLTADEGARIAAATDGGDLVGVAALVARCDGWTGGLILLLAHARAAGNAGATDTPASREAIFEYFGTELFNASPPAIRHLLLRTALMPWFSAAMAVAISGRSDAQAHLDALCRRHLFTERHDTPHAAYRYHPLFQEFLVARVEQTCAPPERQRLARKSAALMQEAGDTEAAVALFLRGGDVEAAVRLILAQAPDMAAQGRLQTLMGWIAALPPEATDAAPWLAYWRGVCDMAVQPHIARAHLERSFACFRAADDPLGQIFAAATIIETYYLEMHDFGPLGQWIDGLVRLLDEQPQFPDPAVELRIHSGLLLSLLYNSAQPSLMARCAKRVRAQLDAVADLNVRLSAACRLLNYLVWIGQTVEAEHLIAHCQPLACDPHASALNRCDWELQLSWYHQYCRYDPAKAGIAISNGLAIVEQHGLHFLAPHYHLRAAMLALEAGDDATAPTLIGRVVPSMDPGAHMFTSWYHGMRSWLALSRVDIAAAIEHAQLSVQAGSACGMAPSHATSLLFRASALARGGDIRGALESLRRGKEVLVLPSRMYEFTTGLLQADLLLALADWPHAQEVIRHTLALGREHGLFNTMQWQPEFVARVCAHALAQQIESDYVRELIRRRSLKPPSPAAANWPWPISVTTLGRFVVEINGVPLHFGHKAPKKPLALLKAIIAHGAQGATRHQLTDALWPDDEADAAHHALNVALHRLRKLLGHADAVRIHDERLMLDADVCWVDVWAFQSLARDADQAAARDPFDLMQRALALYGGHFLADSEDAWAISLRERLRSRFSRLVCACGKSLTAVERWDEALACYRRSLEVDDLAEEFCQGAMRCCLRLKRPSEGIDLYRCTKLSMAATLDVPPSPETESLLAQLRQLLQ